MIKYLLYPITWLFAIIVYIRNALYNWHILPCVSSDFPIISVGNIQVGGTGKTPFVIALSKQLMANNIKPLIITRGYKRNTNYQIVFNHLNEYSAQDVGDEPYYIKQVLKTVPIIIDYNKKNAIKTANQMTNIDCVLLDDGFQSRYIDTDLDVVLISKFPRKFNFTLMPVGRLREPIDELRRADFIYITKDPDFVNTTAQIDKVITERRRRALDTNENLVDFFYPTHLNATFKIKKYKNGNVENNSQISDSGSLIAFCGIADQKHFIHELNKMDVQIEKKIKFGNHVNYDASKYQQLENANPNNLNFITTYKDFVKLDSTFKSKYTIYVLEMNLVLDDSKLLEKIKQLVK